MSRILVPAGREESKLKAFSVHSLLPGPCLGKPSNISKIGDSFIKLVN
jgi:hypothetical protein